MSNVCPSKRLSEVGQNLERPTVRNLDFGGGGIDERARSEILHIVENGRIVASTRLDSQNFILSFCEYYVAVDAKSAVGG
jgi:hypothetical protein